MQPLTCSFFPFTFFSPIPFKLPPLSHPYFRYYCKMVRVTEQSSYNLTGLHLPPQPVVHSYIVSQASFIPLPMCTCVSSCAERRCLKGTTPSQHRCPQSIVHFCSLIPHHTFLPLPQSLCFELLHSYLQVEILSLTFPLNLYLPSPFP